jgi:YfiH family protein
MIASELAFELPGGGHVLFTERAHGNMSSVGGEDPELGHRSRERLRAGIGVRRLMRGHQVHGAVVCRIGWEGLDCDGEPPPRSAGTGAADEGSARAAPTSGVSADGAPTVEADGHATSLRGVGAMVLTADCLPVALGRSEVSDAIAEGNGQSAVAMLHAGWRGLAAGVLEEGVRALGGIDDEGNVVAVVGPGAGVCCYEVGDEVHAAFAGAHRQGRRIDLRAIARDRLLAAGVADVRVLDTCTICDERFFSHRREGAGAGRQAGVAWLS